MPTSKKSKSYRTREEAHDAAVQVAPTSSPSKSKRYFTSQSNAGIEQRGSGSHLIGNKRSDGLEAQETKRSPDRREIGDKPRQQVEALHSKSKRLYVILLDGQPWDVRTSRSEANAVAQSTAGNTEVLVYVKE